ncbi:tetratricopeptide repeat protein [Pandoraea sputorum]|uniref:tetratricopeptide repeat protein n=1 Tax=Pandoraea sputorum TaxID=93222 RepID=UPI001786E6E7|nr:hypothetical protein [Pandoraea sputorum]
MSVTKALCGPRSAFLGTLEHRFELAPEPFEDACTRVAQLYLLPRDDAPPAHFVDPTFMLTVNGQPFAAPFYPPNRELQGPELRLYGRDLVRALAKTIEDQFVTARVPREIASLQAEVIASQLGRDAFLKAGSTLDEARSFQCVYQQAVDVRIDGDNVSFQKTTTYVEAKTKNESAPALVRVVDVAVTFSAKRGDSWLRHSAVRCFGADQNWVIKARVDYAEVRERNGSGAPGAPGALDNLKGTHGVPAPPNWFGTLIQWLKLALGAQGIVFDERHPGVGAAGRVRERPALDGLATFEKEAAFVSARQSWKRWDNGMAKYRLSGTRVFSNTVEIHGSQRLDPRDSEAENAVLKFVERGSERAKGYLQQFQAEHEVEWEHQVSTEDLRYGEAFIRSKHPELGETALRAKAKLDLRRGLRAAASHITIDMPERLTDTPTGQAFTRVDNAYKALHQWASDNRAALGTMPLPSHIRGLLQAVGSKIPGVNPEAFATQAFTAQDFATIADELATRMADTVIDWIDATFTDDVMRRRMLDVVTQSGNGGTLTVIKGYGAIAFECRGGGRKIHIKCDLPKSGKGAPSVMLEHRWDLELDPNDAHGINWGDSVGSLVEEIASANLTVFSAWRVTRAGMELREANYKAHVVGVRPEDKAAEPRVQAEQYSQAAEVYKEATKTYTRDRKHRLAANAYLKAARLYTRAGLHADAAAMYEAAERAYLDASLTVRAAGALLEAAEAHLRARQYRGAIAAYERAEDLYKQANLPKDAANAATKRAETHTLAGNNDEARKIYLTLANEFVQAREWARSVEAFMRYGHTEGQALLAVANDCLRARQYEQAALFYKRAGYMGRARAAYQELADTHLNAMRYEQAVHCYMRAGLPQKAKNANLRAADFHMSVGLYGQAENFYRAAGDYEKAEDAGTRAKGDRGR